MKPKLVIHNGQWHVVKFGGVMATGATPREAWSNYVAFYSGTQNCYPYAVPAEKDPDIAARAASALRQLWNRLCGSGNTGGGE